MKIVCFNYKNQKNWGVYHAQSENITPLTHVWPTHIEGLSAGFSALEQAVQEQSHLQLNQKEVSWSVPVTAENKIFCVGLNYGRHVLEAGRELPKYPSLFLRHIDSFVGHEQNIIKPLVSNDFDYEGELVIVIGKAGRSISEDQAWDHIAGYTCMAENSIRDYQKHAAQVTAGKNFDATGAIGPWILLANGELDPSQLRVQTRLNGQKVQDGNTADFIFSIPALVSYVSTFTQLKPGDLIATGTPEGVGMKRTPPLYMKEGDKLEVEIEHLGVLAVSVINETREKGTSDES